MNDFFIRLEKTERECDRLVFSGFLTIARMDEIKLRLMQMMSTFSPSLEVIVEEVVEFDLSFVQLFHSFMHLLTIKEIDISVRWLTDEEQTRLLHVAGFSKYL